MNHNAVRTMVALLASLTASLAVAGPSVGKSGDLDPFAAAVATDRADRQALLDGGDKSQKKFVKTFDGILALLAKPATSASYAGEMATAAKIAKTLDVKKIADASVRTPLADVLPLYLSDLVTARATLAALVPTLSGKPAKAAAKRLHSADKLLAAAAALTTPRTTLPVYAAAAKLLLPVPGQKDPDGLTWAATIAIDATGSFLYAAEPGDSTQNGTYIGAIRQMRIAADGSVSDLNPRRVVAGIEPRGLATDPSGRFLYVANYGETSISQFAIAADGRLVPLVPPKVAFSNGNPGTLSVDPSGNYLFATGYSPGGSPVTAFAIAADGTLTEKQNAYATQYAAFVSAQPTLSGAGTTFLFTTAAGSGGSDPPELRTFEVGPGGTVTSANVFQSAPSVPKDYLGAVLADPSRAVVYATRSSGSLVPFSIDVAGKITEIPAGSAAFGGSSEAIVMNPAHDRLYVASAGPDHVWQYSVAADGKLGALTPPSVAATVPFAMVMNPAGTRMYVLNGNATGAATDIVQVFTIAADGTLSQP